MFRVFHPSDFNNFVKWLKENFLSQQTKPVEEYKFDDHYLVQRKENTYLALTLYKHSLDVMLYLDPNIDGKLIKSLSREEKAQLKSSVFSCLKLSFTDLEYLKNWFENKKEFFVWAK